jgi:hypothetical protein
MEATATWDERLKSAGLARRAVYDRMGSISEDVLAPLIGPALTGGPRWPSRPAWRVIRRDGRVALASDGLSDPWETASGAGYALEVFMETPEQVLPEGAPLTDLAKTWLFSAVSEISNLIADHGGVRPLLEEFGSVSVEIDGTRFPDSLRNDEGRVGVLLGISARGVPERIVYPGGGDARLLPITVLTRDELAHIVAGGDAARKELVGWLAGSASGHLSVLDRPSTVQKKRRATTQRPIVEMKKPPVKGLSKPKAKAKVPAAKAKVKAVVKKAKAVVKKVKAAVGKAKPKAKAAAKKVKPTAKPRSSRR